jgi:DNA polymerase-1
MAQKNLLLLLDGHALMHRAFHALPPLSVTKTGEPTGAVYGFASMVLKVLNDFKPSHWAIAFDSAAPTFRHLEFEPYKAQRPKAPDELVSQFSRVRELVQAFNIPVYEVAGYEADDILGTLCRQASEQDTDAIIVTGDIDTLQLVSPHVRVLTPRPGRPFSDTVLYDKDAVRQRYDLAPEQMVDFKALKGDPSDNIPGVPGIGEKTAVKLINQFGSVDGIYQQIEEVEPPRIREALKANEQQARQSKRLATIVSDIDITLDLAKCHVSDYDREKVTKLFRELEFSSLLPKLPETAVEKPPQRVAVVGTATDYRIVDTAEALDELMASLSPAKSLVIDVETTGREARRAELVGIALSTAPGRAWYVPVGHRWVDRQLPRAQVIDRLKPLLEDDAITKTAHNGKYDMTVLSRYGVELNGFSFDTMIAAYLLGEKALGLKPLAFGKLGIEMTPITALIGTGAKQITMAQVLVPQAANYACADADICGQLKGLLEMGLKEQGFWSLFTDMEMPLVPVLFRLESNGVALDAALLRDISQSLGQQMKKLEAEIYSSVGHQFNINSPQQLGAVLFEELKLPRARKTKGGYSTDASVLEGLKGTHPVVEFLLDYRQIMKLKSTYIDALPTLIDPETGRVHTNFNQTATATGRLSSSEPNLQNIPVRTEEGLQVRRAFIAEGDSLLLAADYSQIELRIMAHLSQDPRLLAAFAQGEDIHAATASQVFGVPLSGVNPQMRRVAKTVNFGVIYGMSDYGLEQATELSRQEAAQFISAYFDKYSGVKGYLDATKAEAKQKGYVQSVSGRRRYIPEINSANAQVRQAAERMAVNMPVQGTAADIIKLAMIELQRRMDERGLRSKMILQVHDELLFEVPPRELEEVKQLVLEVMPKALEFSVPLKVDVKVGKNWGQLE